MRDIIERSPTTGDTRERALARIAVRPPYFGLAAIEETGHGSVAAMVPAKPPSWPEQGPMEAAQVARHLAILGSCAAALSRDDDEPHHYLATKAHFARLAGGPSSLVGGVLRAEAVASWLDRRTARAVVKLMTNDGQGLHLLDVTYAVLTPKMFLRLNPPIDPAAGLQRNGSGGDVVTEDGDGVSIYCGPITAADCAGHFPDYPAAPVAIVMGRLCRATGRALAAKLDRPVEYEIAEGHVTASRLATLGQRLLLRARYDRPVPGGHLLHGTAMADDEPIGELSVTLATEPTQRD